ncbi:hypothetical protein AMTRI_Chr05g65440 [Amborella trichopoda]
MEPNIKQPESGQKPDYICISIPSSSPTIDNHAPKPTKTSMETTKNSPETAKQAPDSSGSSNFLADSELKTKGIISLAIAMATAAFGLTIHLPFASKHSSALAILMIDYVVAFMMSGGLLLLIIFGSHSIRSMKVVRALVAVGLGLFLLALPFHLWVLVPHNLDWVVSLACGVAALVGIPLGYIILGVAMSA